MRSEGCERAWCSAGQECWVGAWKGCVLWRRKERILVENARLEGTAGAREERGGAEGMGQQCLHLPLPREPIKEVDLTVFQVNRLGHNETRCWLSCPHLAPPAAQRISSWLAKAPSRSHCGPGSQGACWNSSPCVWHGSSALAHRAAERLTRLPRACPHCCWVACLEGRAWAWWDYRV